MSPAITTHPVSLAELAPQGADVEVLRQMLQLLARRLMEIESHGRAESGVAPCPWDTHSRADKPLPWQRRGIERAYTIALPTRSVDELA